MEMLKKNKAKAHKNTTLIWRRYVASALAAVLLLSPGIAVDFIHDQRITWELAVKAYDGLCACAKWAGVSYESAFDVLKNNLGVLITIVSLFLTVNINMAERSEKKIFGIPRVDLENQGIPASMRWLFRTMKIIAFLAPLLMIVCIIEKWCVTGYLLLMLCYVFLFTHYFYHSRTYGMDYNIAQAAALIKTSMEKAFTSEQMFYKHQILLNDFGRSVQNNGEWASAENLFFSLTDEIAKDGGRTLCLACGSLFEQGFVAASPENAMYLLQSYICRLDAMATNPATDMNEEEFCRYTILWSMFCKWVNSASESGLLQFLSWFLAYENRSRENIMAGNAAISQKCLGRQSLMLLLPVEHWLEKYTPSKRETLDCIVKVFEMGKIALCNDDEFWRELSALYSEAKLKADRVFEDYQDYYDRFSKGLSEGRCGTIVQSVAASL